MAMFYLFISFFLGGGGGGGGGSCAQRHAKRRYAIYCFANFLLCSQVKLGWFEERASSTLPLKMTMSRFVVGHFVLFDPQKRRAHFQNLEDVRMTF